MVEDPRIALRAEVKIAEKELARAEEGEKAATSRVKAALRAGDREKAARLAIELDEARDKLGFAKKKVEIARMLEKKGSAEAASQARELERAKALQPLIKLQNSLASALNKARGGGGTDDMIRKLEDDAALGEARFEMAMEDAGAAGARAELEAASKDLAAEELLRQMELDMGIQGERDGA